MKFREEMVFKHNFEIKTVSCHWVLNFSVPHWMFFTLFSLGFILNFYNKTLISRLILLGCCPVICPVPKKGDLSLMGNYQPISLTETTRKPYELSLREQGGLGASRSIIDQIEALDTLIKCSPPGTLEALFRHRPSTMCRALAYGRVRS